VRTEVIVINYIIV